MAVIAGTSHSTAETRFVRAAPVATRRTRAHARGRAPPARQSIVPASGSERFAADDRRDPRDAETPQRCGVSARTLGLAATRPAPAQPPASLIGAAAYWFRPWGGHAATAAGCLPTPAAIRSEANVWRASWKKI